MGLKNLIKKGAEKAEKVVKDEAEKVINENKVKETNVDQKALADANQRGFDALVSTIRSAETALSRVGSHIDPEFNDYARTVFTVLKGTVSPAKPYGAVDLEEFMKVIENHVRYFNLYLIKSNLDCVKIALKALQHDNNVFAELLTDLLVDPKTFAEDSLVIAKLYSALIDETSKIAPTEKKIARYKESGKNAVANLENAIKAKKEFEKKLGPIKLQKIQEEIALMGDDNHTISADVVEYDNYNRAEIIANNMAQLIKRKFVTETSALTAINGAIEQINSNINNNNIRLEESTVEILNSLPQKEADQLRKKVEFIRDSDARFMDTMARINAVYSDPAFAADILRNEEEAQKIEYEHEIKEMEEQAAAEAMVNEQTPNILMN